ncbi:MAG: type II toxin-antitoxin system HicA family toxin [Bacteroidales bacterium]|nr:type II toxin-antitoxin system HicA family toxin [Bacteroidales bacterium]
MSSKEKLITRFCKLPKDFTFDELIRLFAVFGYKIDNKGSTSGSRVLFTNGSERYCTHKPHPGKVLTKAAVIDVYKYLIIKGLL